MSSDLDTTVRLLRDAKAGDESAFGGLLQRYRGRVLARIRALLGERARRHAESGDFLQGVMVEVVRDFDRAEFPDERAFLRWVTHIARNNIRDEVRKRREAALESLSGSISGGPAGTGEGAATRASRREDLERLAARLAELKPDYRTVIELRSLGGLPFKEVAARMGRTSEESVQMLHMRALVALLKKMR